MPSPQFQELLQTLRNAPDRSGVSIENLRAMQKEQAALKLCLVKKLEHTVLLEFTVVPSPCSYLEFHLAMSHTHQ